MKITHQQELSHIVSITSGLLASGHFTYVRQDSKNAEVRAEAIETAETIWSNIKKGHAVEVVEETPIINDSLLAPLAKARQDILMHEATVSQSGEATDLAGRPMKEERKGKR